MDGTARTFARILAELGVAVSSASEHQIDAESAAHLRELAVAGIRSTDDGTRDELVATLEHRARVEPLAHSSIGGFIASLNGPQASTRLDPATAVVDALVFLDAATDDEIDPDFALELLEWSTHALGDGLDGDPGAVRAALSAAVARLDPESRRTVVHSIDGLED